MRVISCGLDVSHTATTTAPPGNPTHEPNKHSFQHTFWIQSKLTTPNFKEQLFLCPNKVGSKSLSLLSSDQNFSAECPKIQDCVDVPALHMIPHSVTLQLKLQFQNIQIIIDCIQLLHIFTMPLYCKLICWKINSYYRYYRYYRYYQ